jgi:hypothetical protein
VVEFIKGIIECFNQVNTQQTTLDYMIEFMISVKEMIFVRNMLKTVNSVKNQQFPKGPTISCIGGQERAMPQIVV